MSEPRWYIKALRDLEADLDNDRITHQEFHVAMAELDRDLDEEERHHPQDYF